MYKTFILYWFENLGHLTSSWNKSWLPLTLRWSVSTASYWEQMALHSVRMCRGAVSRYLSSSCRAASAPSWDWQRSTGWLASRKMPSSHHCNDWRQRVNNLRQSYFIYKYPTLVRHRTVSASVVASASSVLKEQIYQLCPKLTPGPSG